MANSISRVEAPTTDRTGFRRRGPVVRGRVVALVLLAVVADPARCIAAAAPDAGGVLAERTESYAKRNASEVAETQALDGRIKAFESEVRALQETLTRGDPVPVAGETAAAPPAAPGTEGGTEPAKPVTQAEAPAVDATPQPVPAAAGDAAEASGSPPPARKFATRVAWLLALVAAGFGGGWYYRRWRRQRDEAAATWDDESAEAPAVSRAHPVPARAVVPAGAVRPPVQPAAAVTDAPPRPAPVLPGAAAAAAVPALAHLVSEPAPAATMAPIEFDFDPLPMGAAAPRAAVAAPLPAEFPRLATEADAANAALPAHDPRKVQARYFVERYGADALAGMALDDPEAMVNQARLHYQDDGDLWKAIDLLELAIEHNPAADRPWLALFAILYGEGMAPAYAGLAQRLLDHAGHMACWPTVRAVGLSLDADHPLYQAAAGAPADAGGEPVVPERVVEEWLGAALDFTAHLGLVELREAVARDREVLPVAAAA